MDYNDIKTTADYEAYAKDTAETIVENAIEQLKLDDMPVNVENISDYICQYALDHSAIDSDRITIYYYGHELIMQHTDNADYLTDNMGICEISGATSWVETRKFFAFWAFFGDVEDVLSEAITKGYGEHLVKCQEAQVASMWQAGGAE